ncbi:DUF58 domain-containing protein [Thalassobacillus hwangdonensis]|uniref:DUF58 domain-containing protein n=1 Tax=Thalassobacillus hwangdonensis TaxID=546108 RepID=A0ABW3L567_9BACI
MKQWKKELPLQHRKNYDTYYTGIAISAILAIIMAAPVMFVLTGILSAFVIFNKLYDRFAGEGLELLNPKRTIRMFPGDQADLSLTFKNNSSVPILNGKINFSCGSVVKPLEKGLESDRNGRYRYPLHLLKKGESTIRIPFHATSRGTVNIQHVTYEFPHLVNFHTIFMKFTPWMRTEFIVYPQPKTVHGLEEANYLAEGNQTAVFSPFEDVLTPTGTRDYVSSDPFHRIHWKASAKQQQLQTKVLEKKVDYTWAILLNTTETTRLGNTFVSTKLEDLLSYATYLCHVAAKKGYASELHLSSRRPGKVPYFHLPAGEGNQHLKHSLELLARVRNDHAYMNFKEMLHRFDHHIHKPMSIIIMGEWTEETSFYAAKWKAKGMRVFHVIPKEDHAVMTLGRQKEVMG